MKALTDSERRFLDACFCWHRADQDTQDKMSVLRSAGGQFAETILELVPPCADRSAALRKVREAVMTSNLGVLIPAKDQQP